MIDIHYFISAAGDTMLVIVVARVLLGFRRSDTQSSMPSLCAGIGFLIGRYAVREFDSGFDAATTFTGLAGSASSLLISWLGFRYRAARADPR